MNKKYKNHLTKQLYSTLFLIISVFLLLNNFFYAPFNNKIKLDVNSSVASFKYFFSDGISNYFEILNNNYKIITELQTEIFDLKQQLAYTSQNTIIIDSLNKQIETFNELLNVKNIKNIKKIITTTIISNGVRYPNQTFVINLGSADLVNQNTLVISTYGVIGYIKDIYKNYSIIISTVNPEFKISAQGALSKINIVISGNNTLYPDITIYSSNQELIDNELIITSGLEGYFPMGIPLGRIYKDEKGEWKINLLEKFDKLEYVHLVE